MTEITDDDAAVSLAALGLDVAEIAAEPSEWGGWRLDGDTLTYPASPHPNGYRYRIALQRVITAVEALRWLDHIAGKPWDDAAVAGLVRAFTDVLPAAVTGRDVGGPLR